MPHTLGVPGCPKCKGVGVFDGPPREIFRQDGSTMSYPTVIRCSCLEKPADASSGDDAAKPDAQQRAAGEKD